MDRTTIVFHPLIENSLAALRAESTDTASFRLHAGIVSRILVMEATRNLSLRPEPIQTPLAPMEAQVVSRPVVVVPVLRAGLAMLFAAQDLLLDMPVGFLGLERDEETAIAREYYRKFPEGLEDHEVLVIDPMLATGGSLDGTVNALKTKGAQHITLVAIVAAPEGIQFVLERHDDVTLYVAAIDDHLDERKYIVPGLGDFGDRYFGT